MTSFSTKIAALSTAIAIVASTAAALPLAPGDDFTMDYLDNGILQASFNGTVRTGVDLSPFGGALSVDMNAGPDGDAFTITSNGNYCGWSCASSVETIRFSGLDFGASGFVVNNFVDNTGAGSSGGVGAILTVLSPGSFEITWTDPVGLIAMFTTGDVAFSGTFAEDVPSTPVPVPVPASAPLALIGFGALAMMRRRR